MVDFSTSFSFEAPAACLRAWPHGLQDPQKGQTSESMRQGCLFYPILKSDFGNITAERVQTQYFCLKCRKQFQGPAALTVHAFKKHERCADMRYYVEGSQCECCLRHYAGYVELFNHVKRSRRCKQYYMQVLRDKCIRESTVKQPNPIPGNGTLFTFRLKDL